MLLTLYARGEDPVGLGRVHERTSGRLRDLKKPEPATIDEFSALAPPRVRG